MERREAQRPTLLAACAPKPPPWVTGNGRGRTGGPDRKGCPKGSRKPLAPPGAPFPFWGNGKRDIGLPGAANNTGDDARLTSTRHRPGHDWRRSLLRGRVRIQYDGALRR